MTKRLYADVPTVEELYVPTLQALKDLGGSANIDELNEKVYELMRLSEHVLNVPHGNGRTKIEYRLAWTRTRLKIAGYLENSSRAIWALHDQKLSVAKLTNAKIQQELKEIDKKTRHLEIEIPDTGEDQELPEYLDKLQSWKDLLLEQLHQLSPQAFERLAQRLLRESGFIHVEVTGTTGDGGIDGKGILRMNGLLSFHVLFQCKRYKGSVSPSQIRDFRGALQGRAEKGLFITTGRFTRDASKEANRDGAPPIDLVDGDILCDKLKELRLGVTTEMKENVLVDPDWFKRL
jgi:restriction system protein